MEEHYVSVYYMCKYHLRYVSIKKERKRLRTIAVNCEYLEEKKCILMISIFQ